MKKKDLVKEALDLLDKELEEAIDRCVEDMHQYELDEKKEEGKDDELPSD